MSIDPATLRGTWSFPTTVWFGAGKISMLARACKTLEISRPLLVTDPALAALPMVTDAIAANEADGIATTLFSDIKPNPISANVRDGVAALKAAGTGSLPTRRCRPSPFPPPPARGPRPGARRWC